MEDLSFKAQQSKIDKTTVKFNQLVQVSLDRVSGGKVYNSEDINHQHKVGICTAISLVQNRNKANGKRYSADFQYLLQKKYYDLNWIEGSSVLSALKVGKNYGFLPEELFTYVTEQDRYLPYDQYVAKLMLIPESEIERLIKLCIDPIGGYALIDSKDDQGVAKAIDQSKAGVICMYLVNPNWYTAPDGRISWNPKDINPLRNSDTIVGGHAIVMNLYDYSLYPKRTHANTWGIEWNEKGCGDIIDNNYRAMEVWSIIEEPIVKKFIHDIGLGSMGGDVANLQTALKIKGYFKYNVTGYFGPITLLAVRSFQKDFNIPATGYVGPLTRAALNNLFKL